MSDPVLLWDRCQEGYAQAGKNSLATVRDLAHAVDEAMDGWTGVA